MLLSQYHPGRVVSLNLKEGLAQRALGVLTSLVLCCGAHAADFQAGPHAAAGIHKKPGYRIVDGEVIEKDGRRHINIYVRYDDGLDGIRQAPVMLPPREQSPVANKNDYRWGLELFREGKKQQAAKVFEECVLADIFCLDSLRDYLALIDYDDALRARYLNTIVLRVAAKKISEEAYAMLLGLLNPFYLQDPRGALGLIATARKLYGNPEELRSMEDAIYSNRR